MSPIHRKMMMGTDALSGEYSQTEFASVISLCGSSYFRVPIMYPVFKTLNYVDLQLVLFRVIVASFKRKWSTMFCVDRHMLSFALVRGRNIFWNGFSLHWNLKGHWWHDRSHAERVVTPARDDYTFDAQPVCESLLRFVRAHGANQQILKDDFTTNVHKVTHKSFRIGWLF